MADNTTHADLYAALRSAWITAKTRRERNRADGNIDRYEAAEQKAWDALVDFVEDHDLNYTARDPRGPRDVVNDCPLRDMPDHICRSRDWAEREAAGQPGLRPGGDCYEGAYYTMTVDLLAEQLDRLS